MLQEIEGDLLDVESGIICHQVNCQGAYGAGISGQIGRKWPASVRVYRRHVDAMREAHSTPLGTIAELEVGRGKVLCHLFAQLAYGNAARTGRVYTDYGALRNCLSRVRDVHGWSVPIYVPYRIGCGLAGGDWDTVQGILGEFDVTVVRRPSDA